MPSEIQCELLFNPEKPKSRRSYSPFYSCPYSAEELSTEEWRDVLGFEADYQISNIGRIRSKYRVRDRHRYGRIEKVPMKGVIVNPTIDSCGYPQVKLYGSGFKKSFKLHKIVALAFLPNPENLPCVNHCDGNKQNPRLCNLEYCSHGENTRHAWRTGLCTSFKGEQSGMAKLKDSDIPIIRARYDAGEKVVKIAADYNISSTAISYVGKRKTYRHVK